MLIIIHVLGFLYRICDRQTEGKVENVKSHTPLLHAPLRATGACVTRASMGPPLDGEVSSPRHGRSERRLRQLRAAPPSAGSLPVAPATSSPPHQPEFILHAQVLTTIMMCTAMQKYLRGCEEIKALATLLRANSLMIEKRSSAASLGRHECISCCCFSGGMGLGSAASIKHKRRCLTVVTL